LIAGGSSILKGSRKKCGPAGSSKHNRQYVLHDMDLKDIPIRMIIYGEQEIENWSHRIAARRHGIMPLPWIKVKTVESKEEGHREARESENRR
jgi:hypothetical protein